jgi:hypothetical protein
MADIKSWETVTPRMPREAKPVDRLHPDARPLEPRDYAYPREQGPDDAA